jgi:hypothetical protein
MLRESKISRIYRCAVSVPGSRDSSISAVRLLAQRTFTFFFSELYIDLEGETFLIWLSGTSCACQLTLSFGLIFNSAGGGAGRY